MSEFILLPLPTVQDLDDMKGFQWLYGADPQIDMRPWIIFHDTLPQNLEYKTPPATSQNSCNVLVPVKNPEPIPTSPVPHDLALFENKAK